MIADALDGKIDMIITKSISRFARNTVDSLTTIRRLQEKGVAVWFEKENIDTSDSKGELLITIMSGIAQEESRSLSENISWGWRKRMADGKVAIPYGRFLGYEKGEDGLPKVVESEAKTVRMIYTLFLEGKSYNDIAAYLTRRHTPTPSHNDKPWHSSTVKSILHNEKYRGSALLQKGFTENYLTKRKRVNRGEVPQYWVEESHPAIVEPEVHDLVQAEIQKREGMGTYQSSKHIFSSKIVCGDCGSFFGSKTWHSNTEYRKTIWRCNNKYNNGVNCTTRHLYEEQIKESFIIAVNRLYAGRSKLREDFDALLPILTDTVDLDSKISALHEEQARLDRETTRCIEKNARTAQDQAVYQTEYTALIEQREQADQELKVFTDEYQARIIKREAIQLFLAELDQCGPLKVFDEGVWFATVEKLTVGTEGVLTFTFKDGTELTLAEIPTATRQQHER
ncbi:serine recombinase [Clostridia bacterium]|nr:serine recombinase [Clostridia bacterium]